MALATFGNALTAIREVLDDGSGSLRTISSSRFADKLPESVHESERQRRGITASKPFRVRVTNVRRNASSPPMNGSVHLLDFDVTVTVSRTIKPLEQMDSDAWATLEALAWEDADAIRQALCTPPNLETTSGAADTNIVGCALRYRDSSGRPTPTQTDGAQRYETTHRLSGILKVSPATM